MALILLWKQKQKIDRINHRLPPSPNTVAKISVEFNQRAPGTHLLMWLECRFYCPVPFLPLVLYNILILKNDNKTASWANRFGSNLPQNWGNKIHDPNVLFPFSFRGLQGKVMMDVISERQKRTSQSNVQIIKLFFFLQPGDVRPQISIVFSSLRSFWQSELFLNGRGCLGKQRAPHQWKDFMQKLDNRMPGNVFSSSTK